MTDTDGSPQEPGLEATVARLEAEVVYIQRDLAELKSMLRSIAQRGDEMRGFIKAKWPEFSNIDRFALGQ